MSLRNPYALGCLLLLLQTAPVAIAAPRPILRDPVTPQPQAQTTYRLLSYCQERSARQPHDVKTFRHCQATQCDEVLLGTTDDRGRVQRITRPCRHAKYYVQQMVGDLSDNYGRYFRLTDSLTDVELAAWPYRIAEQRGKKKIPRHVGCTDACGFTAYVMGPVPRTLHIDVLDGEAADEQCSQKTNTPAPIKKQQLRACPVFPVVAPNSDRPAHGVPTR
ncbi:MAG: hypothetical protein HY696_11810 [Deltaproteobacteria bacterium]|nr:hypothetical protein [Deltaproteobacteria bacterium]